MNELTELRYCFGLNLGDWYWEEDEDGNKRVGNQEQQFKCAKCPLIEDCYKATSLNKDNISTDLIIMIGEQLAQITTALETKKEKPKEPEVKEKPDEVEQYIKEEQENALKRAEHVRQKRQELQAHMQQKRNHK